MTVFLLFVNLALFVLLAVTVFNVLTAPMVKNGPLPLKHPLVSVLIPARNEAARIGRALQTLKEQTYHPLEILVLDDGSTDGTGAVVDRFAAADPRIRGIVGEPPPPGWTGKNWACHCLSLEARGEFLIFTDADNFFNADAVAKTVGLLQKYRAALISAFPQQITFSFAEKLAVPVFDFFVYSLLPLWATYYIPFPSLAAANGQWLAFSRQGYDRIGGHDAVKSQIVEDTELARLAKRKGEKTLTAAGRDAVFGRMYSGGIEVFWGFSKNAFGLMGYRTLPFFIFIFMLFCMFILPYFLLPFPSFCRSALSAVLLGSAARLAAAVKFSQPIIVGTLLNPLSFAYVIAVNSFLCNRRGYIMWKNRRVNLRGNS